MKKILHLLILVLALIFIVLWLMENPGEASFIWLGYEVQTSMAVLIGLIIAVSAVVYILRIPVSFVRWVHRSFERRQAEFREKLVFQILNAYLAQDAHTQNDLYKKIDKSFSVKSPYGLLLKQLLKPSAQTADALAGIPLTALAGAKGQIMSKETENSPVEALDIALKTASKYPHTAWLTADIFRLQIKLNRWDDSLKTLEELKTSRALDKGVYLSQKAAILLQLDKAKEAFETAPFMTEAALRYATEVPEKAASVLKKAWKKNPSWSIYKAFTALLDKSKPLSAYKKAERFIESAPVNPLTHLALADAALMAHLWGQAGKELDIYLAAYPVNVPAVEMKIYLEKEANNNKDEAAKWEEKLQKAGTFTPYTCAHCGRGASEWTALCPSCHTLGSLN